MAILDLSCVEAESFHFSYNYFVVMHKNLLWLYILQPVCLHPTAPPNVEALSSCLVGSAGRNASGSGKAGTGWQWLARKRSRQRRGFCSGTCAPGDGAHYLRTGVSSNSCQNGELKHRL